VNLCTQARYAGGEYTVAWREWPLGHGRRVILCIADIFPDQTAGREAVTTVEKIFAADFDTLLASDEFGGRPGDPALPLVWQWNHNPDDRFWSLTHRPGYLRLTTGLAPSRG